MNRAELETLVGSWVENIIAGSDIELVAVDYVKEGRDWFLRVFIDKPDGIGVEDCRTVSLQLSEILDKEDPIVNAYYLEVSSPGLERPLKKAADFHKYIGHLINVRTYEAIDGQKEFQGKLFGFANDIVHIKTDQQEWKIPVDKIAKARLALEF